MNRHTIVLAEEKGGIQRLVKKAIDTKPQGQERIESVTLVNNETEFLESLNHYPSIILLSTTFAETSHEALVKAVAERLPRTKVISLTHKYGDRSSLEYGAFDSVDKPIRNPVLWRVLDGAIEAVDSDVPANRPIEPQQKEVEKSIISRISVPVVDKESHVLREPVISEPIQKEEPVVLEEPSTLNVNPRTDTPRHAQSAILVIADDDDDDDDDLFGSDVLVRRNPAPVIVESPAIELVQPEEEPVKNRSLTAEEVEESWEVQAKEPENALESTPENEFFSFALEEDNDASEELGQNDGMNTAVPAVEFDILQKRDDEQETEEKTASIVNSDEEEHEPESKINFDFEPESSPVDSHGSHEVESTTVLETEMLSPALFAYEEEQQSPESLEIPVSTPASIELEPASNALEPEREINTEASTYNELSEWTLAHEGFKTKKGEFVPLAPPRERMMKHSTSGGKAYRTTATKVVSNEVDGLFGSVRNIFKKK